MRTSIADLAKTAKTKKMFEALKLQPLSEEEKQKRHILGRLYGPIATTKESTRNGRLYNRDLWEKALSDDIFKEKIKTKSLFLELGHPADREETDMSKVCACIPEAPEINQDGDLYAYVDILDTPNGKILKTLCDYGFVPGISSRGSGDVDMNDEVDPDTFYLETWDIVQLPAVKKARLQVVESFNPENKTLREKLTESIDKAKDEKAKEVMKESLKNLNIDIMDSVTKFKNSLIEAYSDKKRKEIIESAKKHGIVTISGLKEYMDNKHVGIYGLYNALLKENFVGFDENGDPIDGTAEYVEPEDEDDSTTDILSEAEDKEADEDAKDEDKEDKKEDEDAEKADAEDKDADKKDDGKKDDKEDASDKKDDKLPADPEAAKLEVHTMLNDLVADEIEAINGYDDAKAQIIDTPIEHKDNILDTIDHIKSEEQEHIDELIGATTEIPFDKEENNDFAAEEESLAEETHAQYAKPEGNRVAAYNNALKYAKKENKPFIYGYTNRAGKFFAAETPMKVKGSPADAEKEFRSRYKNCNVVYVVYPDKDFIDENLKEDKKVDKSEDKKFDKKEEPKEVPAGEVTVDAKTQKTTISSNKEDKPFAVIDDKKGTAKVNSMKVDDEHLPDLAKAVAATNDQLSQRVDSEVVASGTEVAPVEAKEPVEVGVSPVEDEPSVNIDDKAGSDVDDVKGAVDATEEVGDTEAADVFESVKKLIRQKTVLESKVRGLTNAKTVSDAKIAKLSESLDKYKDAYQRVSELAKDSEELRAQVKSLSEQLTQKDEKIKNLEQTAAKAKKLDESMIANSPKVETLNEQLRLANNENTKLKAQVNSLSSKMNENADIAKKYKQKFVATLTRYIESKAKMLGCKPTDITSKLAESYTLSDIDAVCDRMMSATVNMGRLPVSSTTRVKMNESIRHAANGYMDPDSGYSIDPDLLELAGLTSDDMK